MNDRTVIGSIYEISQRIVVMMNSLPNLLLDERQIAAIDFIAVYAEDFDIIDKNLHGYGNYRFSEYASRKALTSAALKQLVLKRLVNLNITPEGYTYSISDAGMERYQKLDNSYAKEYSLAVKAVLQRFPDINSTQMEKEINRVTALSLKEPTL